ncbi:MBL fold metallo-hydrolase [Streptomyces sp. NBC_00306]|uniref:MBL fold metallo-hydrolase n=1 Tax=Streptomyces sp. NBC_00306 TaxID=2975708 RepID=UPI002E2C2D51|nr:MBL fold metallo-hydrolase [Streptomyces sp. NBC_00306]
MFFIDTLGTEGLGNRGYVCGGTDTALVVDPPRDIDRVLAAAAVRGVRIEYVAETHVHNDAVSGGLELARVTGARYLVPAEARVTFPRTPVADGDEVALEPDLTVRALATPGHTPHHTSYVLADGGHDVAVFTGGSLLIGGVGRPDLVEPALTERLARAQHASAHRLADALHDDVQVLPTHGFGSFCASSPPTEQAGTIGQERRNNEAFALGTDAFVSQLLAGLDDVPAYYARVGALNAAGPAPVDLTAPPVADADEVAARLAAGEWVVDVRSRTLFSEGHVSGSFNIEAEGRPATYLAWLIPDGKPVTLLAASPAQLAAVQRELVRVGIDRPVAAATGDPGSWIRAGEMLRLLPRADFAALAQARGRGEEPVVLDVRRDSERAGRHVEGSVHIPVHELQGRVADVPPGVVWVHCATGLRATIGASLLEATGRDVVTVDDDLEAAESAGLMVAG